MLYTRRVIGEETLSSTNPFKRCHSASFSVESKSFILGPVNALGLYRECGGAVQPGNKMKAIADAFPIQAIELSR
jgi:hypothetical protein